MKSYESMKVSVLGSLAELTQLGLGKSGPDTDGQDQQGNMNFIMMNMDMTPV